MEQKLDLGNLSVKVFMLGWEYPPHMTGGLGTACQGLVKALLAKGTAVTFVVPGVKTDQAPAAHEASMRRGLFHLERIGRPLDPYRREADQPKVVNSLFASGNVKKRDLYAGDLLGAVENLADKAMRFGKKLDFDVIHAHDWMTFPAGLRLREATGRPLVAHLHSTEYDRCLSKVWPPVCEIEGTGLNEADRVITVSSRSKQLIHEKYGVAASRITVVHNALNRDHLEARRSLPLPSRPDGKIVLFMGRITAQKGPEYLIETAGKVLATRKDTIFVLAGTGDMVPGLIERAAELGIADKVLFTGFLEAEQLRWMLDAAFIFVMPSVSDPFGISCLEAMYCGTPVIVSKQSGISEMVENVEKVDYWDVETMAARITHYLDDPRSADALGKRAAAEARLVTWEHPAEQCLDVYNEVVAESGSAAKQE